MREMNHTTWKIAGRTRADILPDDWREQLAVRLGQRPRRIGLLAELALYGALDCLADANETTLPKDDLVRICSLRGPTSAISQVLIQNQQDLPMPFSFLQSQTSQLLPALANALSWQGDAAVILARNAMDLATLAAHQAGNNGMLLGWVEEAEPCQSFWLRLSPCEPPPADFVLASSFEEMISPSTCYWRLGREGMEIYFP